MFLEIKNLVKSYENGYNILNGLTFSLKKGEVFDATIPGKFSTYLKFNKPIFGLNTDY